MTNTADTIVTVVLELVSDTEDVPLATRVTVVDVPLAEAMQRVPRESAIEKKVENETTKLLRCQQQSSP